MTASGNTNDDKNVELNDNSISTNNTDGHVPNVV